MAFHPSDKPNGDAASDRGVPFFCPNEKYEKSAATWRVDAPSRRREFPENVDPGKLWARRDSHITRAVFARRGGLTGKIFCGGEGESQRRGDCQRTRPTRHRKLELLDE
jgi:hypothetical protein